MIPFITFWIISMALWNVLSLTKYSSHFVIRANASSKWRCAISVWISSCADVTHSGAYLTFTSTSLTVDVGLTVASLTKLVFVVDFGTSVELTGRLGGCGAGVFFFFNWLNFKATSNLSIHSFWNASKFDCHLCDGLKFKHFASYLCRWTDALKYLGIFWCDDIYCIFHTIQIFYVDNSNFCGIILGGIFQFSLKIKSSEIISFS